MNRYLTICSILMTLNSAAVALLAAALFLHSRCLTEVGASLRYQGMEIDRHTRILEETSGLIRRKLGQRASD
jgi:ABC-type tungstate transport system substrate-binding protein